MGLGSHLKVQHEYSVPRTHRHHSIIGTKPQTQHPSQEGAENGPPWKSPCREFGHLCLPVKATQRRPQRPLGSAKPSALGLCAEEYELWSDFGSSRELKTLEFFWKYMELRDGPQGSDSTPGRITCLGEPPTHTSWVSRGSQSSLLLPAATLAPDRANDRPCLCQAGRRDAVPI